MGDALPFIYGDRFDLKPLAFREDPGFLTGKAGARLERAILRRACGLGVPAILNDLTHTLRHGDVTAFRPDGKFILIEAKSGRGGKFSRNQRQRAAAQTMASYLETDSRQDEDGQIWQRVALSSDPPDHAGRVVALASRLQPGEVLHDEVEAGLHYVLVHCGDDGPKDYGAAIGFLIGRPMLVLSANDHKRLRLGYTPFALTLSDPHVAACFYAGDFIVQILVDLDQVAEAFARRGFAFRMDDDEMMPWRVWPLGESEVTTAEASATSFHMVGRLSAEFVTLDWLVESASIRPAPETIAQLIGAGTD